MSSNIEILPIAPLALGEGPLWCSDAKAFYWLDIIGKAVHRLRWPSLQHDRFTLPEMTGCMALRDDGALALALPHGLYRFDPADESLSLMVEYETDEQGRRSNDGTVDRQGRFWFSTVSLEGWREKPTGRVYCCDRTGKVHFVRDGLWMPNGMAAAADGKTFYLSDSFAEVRKIWTVDLDAEQVAIGDQRLFFDTAGRPGRPDGAAIDEDGCYWMAGVSGGELVRLTPDGAVDRVIEVPVSHPTKPCFGGPDLDLMLVTSLDPAAAGADPIAADAPGGSTLLLRLGLRGLANTAFICS